MLKHLSLSQSQCHAYIVAFILSSGEVILLYSRCAKEELVYVVIAALSSRQPSSCSEYTSVNMQSSCNICSVSNAKYIFYIYLRLCPTHSISRNTWYYARLLALLCTL